MRASCFESCTWLFHRRPTAEWLTSSMTMTHMFFFCEILFIDPYSWLISAVRLSPVLLSWLWLLVNFVMFKHETWDPKSENVGSTRLGEGNPPYTRAAQLLARSTFNKRAICSFSIPGYVWALISKMYVTNIHVHMDVRLSLGYRGLCFAGH